jgi:hypothetical protein
MPMKRSARPVAAASWVMEIDEVLLAMMVSGADHGLDFAQELQLQALVLGGGLDHDVGILQVGHLRRRPDACHRGGLLLGRHLLLLDQPVEAARNGGDALLHRRVVDVQHHRIDAHHRTCLRDAVAHGSGADDADGLDRHDCLLAFT